MAVISFIGLQIKKELKNWLSLREKKEIVKTCVLAVNRMYKDKPFDERYKLALDNITNILNSKKIVMSEFEIRMLMEEVYESINIKVVL